MQVDCKGILGRLFGHKYQPRYSTSKPHPEAYTSEPYLIGQLRSLMEASKTCVYQNDVCVRCGHVVNVQKDKTP